MKVKVVDIDVVFDNFLVKYISENKGKFTEKEWEEKIPVLYLEFGSTPIDELGGIAPEKYYEGLSGSELALLLEEHVEQGVPVSDFLCEALIASDCEKYVVDFIDNEHNEELIFYSVNILSDKGSTIAFDRYFKMLLSDETSEDLKELLAEKLATVPEESKETALELYSKAGSSAIYFLEIFSLCKHDDRILNILVNELKNHLNDIPLYLTYITRYGDEKALPHLLEVIKNPSINYSDFRELKFAVELFGGSYEEERDFSGDKYYNKLKGNKNEDINN
jgi:hypothetical protein